MASNNSSAYKIRPCSPQEWDTAVQWAANEGWNPGRQDRDCFYKADPNGFLLGFLDDEPIASISVVRYDNSFGFLGFYIVKPEFRGRGYGLKIWQAGIDYLHGCNIGLDGVIDQQENYKKAGFKFAYRNIRYKGFGSPSKHELNNQDSSLKIVPASSVPLDDLIKYDNELFPSPRLQFLQNWITQADCKSICITQSGEIRGYGVLRHCHSGYKIGPLFADNKIYAEILFDGLVNDIPQATDYYLDTPEPNASAVNLAVSKGMNPVFETARMYNQNPPSLAIEKIFGVTTFELG
jgi:GNAT superfamily N-acetyltransferase